MKRYRFLAIVVVAILAVTLGLALAGCERKVQVKVGERVMCEYGHEVSNTIRTIEVPADKASAYGVRTRSVICPEHQEAAKLYEAAQDDIAKADLKAAAAKLAKVLAVDPAFKTAKAQLDEIEAGRKPKPDTSGSGPSSASNSGSDDSGETEGESSDKPSTPGDDEKPSGPIASLAGWMPDELDGFTAEKVYADVFTISREYLPKSNSSLSELVIAAEQFANNAAAKESLGANVKLPYGGSAKTLKVNGNPGYFGTKGDVAVLGITDGPVLVIFQMRATSGKPNALYDDLVKVAEGLPR